MLTNKQQELYNDSIPFEDLKCEYCKWDLIYKFKEFIDWWPNVCDRCLFYYNCSICNKEFKIYSDWALF